MRPAPGPAVTRSTACASSGAPTPSPPRACCATPTARGSMPWSSSRARRSAFPPSQTSPSRPSSRASTTAGSPATAGSSRRACSASVWCRSRTWRPPFASCARPGSSGWVPYFFDRLDEHVEKRGRLAPECKREPREYLARGQLHVSCEPEESALPFVTATLGDHFVMYASDYPHWDSDFPNSTRGLRERTDLAPEVKARIMGANAAEFYRLPA